MPPYRDGTSQSQTVGGHCKPTPEQTTQRPKLKTTNKEFKD